MTSGLAFRSYMRAARRRAGMTQKEFGAKFAPKIPEGRISDIERGLRNPTRDEISQFEKVLSGLRAGSNVE